ncbi:MAG: alpha-L-rhamnosidase, partial [Lentisphaeria bacterium]|nr:alpha-L-rhamnosidase [Lentisphaeria bacterium]
RVRFGESVSETLGDANEDCSRKNALLELPNYGQIEYGNTVFRFVRLLNESETDVKIQGLSGIVLERDLEVTGSFHSSDEELDLIWKTAVRTVHLCMQDFIYDGAKRDRVVWMGDMHPEIRTILCAFSDTSIIPDSLEFLIKQTPEDQPVNGIQTYSCWLIVALWDYVCVSGDIAFLRRHSERIRLMLKIFRSFIREDGSENIPEHRFLDWPNENSPEAKHAGIQALLLWMMQAGARLLRLLGEDDSSEIAAQKLLKRHVPDPVGRKAPAALMTLTGLADFRHVLENDPFRDVSTFYGYYVLQAKETVPALALLRKYWGGMLKMGATSFWEDFDLDWMENAFGIDSLPVPGKKDIHGDFGNYCYKGLRHSLSHGWSGGPAPFLSERVLGVSFPAPGKVRVRPDPGDLQEVCGTVPTPFGLITVEADRSGKTCIKIPDGLERV